MRRLLEIAALVVLSCFLLWRGIAPAWTSVHSDFANYYVSSRLVVEHASLDSLYDDQWFQKQIDAHQLATKGKFAPFPPATAWLMIPLTPFSPLVAQRIWTVINLCCLIVCIFLLSRLTSWPISSTALLLLAGGLSLANNFAFGQLYLVMLTAMLLAYAWEVQRKSVLAGSTLSLFTIVKYFPASILLGYLLRGHWRIVISALAVGLSLILLQVVFFGTAVMTEFVHHILLPHLDGNLRNQGQFTYNYQSWESLLTFMFLRDPVYNPSPLLHAPAAKVIFKAIIYSLFLSSAGVIIWKSRQRKESLFVALSMLSLVALALLPASATYHFILLLFPIAVLIQSRLLNPFQIRTAITLFVLIGFIPYGFAFRLAHEYGLFIAYPRLWLVTGLYLLVAGALLEKHRKSSAIA